MADYMTTKQLVELLQLDRTTIYRMLSAGRLPGFKVGGRWRFSRQEIEAWLRERGRTSTAFSRGPAEKPIPIVSIVGRSGVGRTTLLEKLIPELKRRGYRVATIKHHAHPGFEIDQPGKDTWRHAQAGSDQVVIAAPDSVVAIRYVDHALTLNEIAASIIHDADIILTEGYSGADKPKIEVMRAARSKRPICDPAELLATASDIVLPLEVPHFDLGDVAGLADLIEARFLSQSGA